MLIQLFPRGINIVSWTILVKAYGCLLLNTFGMKLCYNLLVVELLFHVKVSRVRERKMISYQLISNCHFSYKIRAMWSEVFAHGIYWMAFCLMMLRVLSCYSPYLISSLTLPSPISVIFPCFFQLLLKLIPSLPLVLAVNTTHSFSLS